jgi:hypothetical protein
MIRNTTTKTLNATANNAARCCLPAPKATKRK